MAIGAIALIAVIAGCESSSDDDDGDQAAQVQTETDAKKAKSEKEKPKPARKDDGCGSRATDDCTPHVGPKGSVRVDALIYKVKSVQTAAELGDQEFGLGEKADGRFVIVTLEIRSDKDESVTLTGSEIQLEVNGNKYDADNEGTVAAVGAGEDPLFIKDIGPDVTITSKVVYDVPTGILGKKIEVRFNELGFGESHAYIRLPKLPR